MAKENYSKEDLKLVNDILSKEEKRGRLAQSMKVLLQEQLKQGVQLSDQVRDRIKNMNLLAKTEKGSLDINKDIESIDKKIAQAAEKAAKHTSARHNSLADAYNIDIKTLKTERQRLVLQKRSNDIAAEQGDILMNNLKSVVNFVEKIPGGKMLTAALGFTDENLTKIGDNLKSMLAGGPGAPAKKFKNLFDGVATASKGTLVKLIGFAAPIAIGVVLFTVFKKLLVSFSEIVDEVGKQFGVMGTQDLAGPLVDAQPELIALGKSSTDWLTIVETLSSEFGQQINLSAEQAQNILDSATAMGLSADEGAKLFGTLMQIGNLTQAQAENLAESTYQLARAEGVAPHLVMKDIAESSEIIAKYGADNLDSIMRAAIQARKLGLELSDVDTIVTSLLDFQSSLSAEMEASLMIGKQLNFQRARQLALAGDMEGMMNTVLDQLGGEAEFNELNVLQKESLAKSLGITTVKMAKLVQENGKLGTQRSFADMLGEDTISNLTKIFNKIKTIGAEIMKKVAPVLNDLVEDFEIWLKNDGWKAIKAGIEGVVATLKWIVDHRTIVATMLGALSGAAFGPWGALVGGLAAGATMAFSPVGGLESFKKGGQFTTSGPTPIMVGDNPGGREIVTVTPISSNAPGLAEIQSSGKFDLEIRNEQRKLTDNVHMVSANMATLIKNMEGYFGHGGLIYKKGVAVV